MSSTADETTALSIIEIYRAGHTSILGTIMGRMREILGAMHLRMTHVTRFGHGMRGQTGEMRSHCGHDEWSVESFSYAMLMESSP